MSDPPRLSVVSDEPCYACQAKPGTRCAAAWHVVGADIPASRCLVNSGEFVFTPVAARRVAAAIRAGKRGSPPGPSDPPLLPAIRV